MRRREDLISERVRSLILVTFLTFLIPILSDIRRAESLEDYLFYLQIVRDGRKVGVFPFRSKDEVYTFLSKRGVSMDREVGKGLKVIFTKGGVRFESMDGKESILFGIPIDINRADVDDLTALPGIGKELAMRIVKRRKEKGPFCSIDDLGDVKGIGRKKIERIRRFITVKPDGGCF